MEKVYLISIYTEYHFKNAEKYSKHGEHFFFIENQFDFAEYILKIVENN